MLHFIDRVNENEYRVFEDDAPSHFYAGMTPCTPRPSTIHDWINDVWVLDETENESKRIQDIRNEADGIVLNAYTKDKQDKIMMEAIYLNHEKDSRVLTAEELAFMDWAVSVRNWIKSVRDIENACQADDTLPVDFSGIGVAP